MLFTGALSVFETVAAPFKNETLHPSCIEIVPDTEEFKKDFILIAREYYEQGLYGEVISELMANLTKHPEQNNQAFELLARSYANQGKLSEALEWCERGIKLNPLDAQLYYLRSSIFQSQQQPKAVLESLRKSLFLDPGFILSHYALGNYYLRDGQKTKAARNYKNALSLALKMDKGSLLPEGEGLTAGRLVGIVETTLAAL